MIQRNSEEYLRQWYTKKNRKPLVIRGARQVGKSTLVREFSKKYGCSIHEINLEKHFTLEEVFKRLDVKEILQEISLITGKPMGAPGGDLLFLDEIQSTPSAIPALRYLYEEKPELPVIAAGSLLEFTLKEHNYSMPVGRIEFLYLGPVTFSEFLAAKDCVHFVDYIKNYTPSENFSREAHDRLCTLLREYLITGGMPEAVAVYLGSEDFTQALQVHHSILDTYRNDFSKYASGTVFQRLQRVYSYIPGVVGEKFKYRNVNPDWQAREIRHAVDLLDMAGIIFKVHSTSGSGIPLDANADNRVFKTYFLDAGLMNTASGVKTLTREEFFTTRFINEGKLAEQFIAQHLLFSKEPYIRPQLHYWLRESRKNNAEVDFLIQSGRNPVPLEVKAGKSGSLKSLHLFCGTFNLPTAVRFNLTPPSVQECNHKIVINGDSKNAHYKLLSIPLYMIEELQRILEQENTPL